MEAWKVEALFVFTILALIASISGSTFTDWSSASAVFLGFINVQMAFDLTEKESATEEESQSQLKIFHVLKESVWLVTFLAMGSYPLLVSSLIFMTYPTWRKLIRRQLPSYVQQKA